MRNANFTTNFVCQFLQVLLKVIVPAMIAAAAVTQDQNGSGVGIIEAALILPPIQNAVASKFTGVFAGADIDISPLHVIS